MLTQNCYCFVCNNFPICPNWRKK